MEEPKHRFDENIESIITKNVFEEYSTSKTNQIKSGVFSDFEANLDVSDGIRAEKNYDWMSDISTLEANSIFLTEAANESLQYFSSRDFVDIYLENGSSPKDVLMCRAAKKNINSALNNKGVHHYYKYMQSKEINRLAGYVYAVCWWEQEVKDIQIGINRWIEADLDESGAMRLDIDGNPVYVQKEEPKMGQKVLRDQFNWMPLDPRNVFPVSNKYTYSAQEEEGIILRSEKTYWELKKEERSNNYFNLDLVKELRPDVETETSRETYNKGDREQKIKKYQGPFDVFERYGPSWAKVTKRDNFGYAVEAVPAFDDNREPSEDSEYILMRIAWVQKGNTKILIRFHPELLRDGLGNPYIPIIRGISYVHATKKNGMSTGKYLRDLQIAADDTINMSNNRVTLATTPTFIGTEGDDNNDSLFIEPEHLIKVDDPNTFKELKISSDIQGAVMQYNIFKGSMQQVASTYPTTMGDPGKSNITATAIAGSDARSNVRNGYKSLTQENTFNNELYWMILNMTWQFMHPETIKKVFSPQEIMVFNPVGDYTYQPVTTGIEQEHNKNNKVRNYDQILGRIQGLAQGNPAIIPIIAYILGQQLELMGSEYRAVEPMIKKLMGTPMQPEEGPGGPREDRANQISDMPAPMVSNQSGMEVMPIEASARMGAQ